MIIKNNKLSVLSWLLPLITVGMLIGLVACPSDSGSSGNGAPSATPLTVSHNLVGDDLTVTVAYTGTATLSDNLVVSVVLTPTGGTAMTKMVTLDADTDNGTALFADLAVSEYSLSATATGAQFTYTGGTTNGIAIAVLEPLATLGTPSSASIAEGASDGSESATVVVSLSRAPTAAVTVLVHISPAPDADSDYAVTGAGITIGTATSSALPVMVNLDADNLMRTLTITAAEDADGTSESLALALQASTGYTIGTATPRTIAINDNNPLASLGTPSSAIIVEGATGGSESATVVISLGRAPTAAVTLLLHITPAPDTADYTVSGTGIAPGTATGGMLPVTVSLDATNPTRTLTISAANDDDDIAEALTIALQPGNGYRIDSSGSGNEQILAINDIPLLSCEFRNSGGNTVITEINEDAGAFVIRFVLPATIEPDTTFVHAGSSLNIKYNIGGGDTNPIVAADLFSGDFGNNKETSIQANPLQRNANIILIDDMNVEPNETLLVTLLPNDDPADEYAYRLSDPATCGLTIIDSGS